MNFEHLRTEPVRLEGPEGLLSQNLMSPFAWRPDSDSGEIRILVRATPPDKTKGEESGRIWFGVGDAEGLAFRMQEEALITPGPSGYDIKGCEDPTVVEEAGGCVVYYTGVEEGGDGHLCFAEGRDLQHLIKRGVAHRSTRSERNTKEATVLRDGDGTWRLLFEYAHDGKSRIGLAVGDGADGPWTEKPDPFAARPDRWDRWHLSTGPLLRSEPERPVMFYNGADKGAEWGIGWVALTPDLTSVVERCEDPIIAPPTDPHARDIAFAASLVTRGDEIWLYYSKNDRELFRATLKQT